MALLPFPQSDVRPHFRNPNPNPSSSFILSRKSLSPKILYRNDRRNFRVYAIASRISNPSGASPTRTETLRPYPALLQLAASAIFFVSLGARACTSGPAPIPSVQVATCQLVQESVRESADCGVRSTEPESGNQVVENSDVAETVEDKELKAAFERWKSKTYALTVPLRIVALRGSIPPSWIKEFVQVQGKRLKLQSELRGSLEHIFSDLALAFKKGRVEPKSTMAADIVTIGDSWLHLAISKGIIEPIHDVEGQNWFKSLDDKWKDWRDLWRPELAGRISMVDAPREVVGAVLKYMGASYNTKDIESQVGGGRNATMQNLAMLQRQVRLFDSVHYLKAFGVGDVWVAVGWSSDVLPAAKRISNVAVIVPKSGTSLWADLWAIPAATKFTTNQIGGRVRSPSPLIHQWIEFCLQAARALPFRQEVIPGASPLSLEDIPVKEGSLEFSKVRPKLDTNLVAGVPPPEILAKCEFLEPLSEATLMDYQWLIAGMQKQGRGWIESMLHGISSKTFQFKLGTQKP
ncbi:uncharacterized protein LOC131233206 isoform X2 [Magnolia sinica]|uniref:uncharacterized protein LOC131233206 isoform X2 n=1 Tax=Magnolia sinica TaxID=86752 RepID=UPI0026586D2E|nr:uncharacterized protein LOC131233206 isoform X2 [Magnolia sinica]